MRHLWLAGASLSVVVWLNGCQTAPLKVDKREPPVIAYWDCGIYGIRKPYVLNAVWEDGTVIWREGDSDRLGSISPAEVHAALERIEKAGFCRIHFQGGNGIAGPDQRLRFLVVFDGKQRWTAFYNEYGVSEHLRPSASFPSRLDLERFDSLWTNVVSIIRTMQPSDGTKVRFNGDKWCPCNM